MITFTKRWLLATGTVVLIAAAGCSATVSGSAASEGGGGSAPSAAVDSGAGGSGACGSESGFCVTVDITGATTMQGSAQALNLGTCADYAKNGSPGGGLQFPGVLGKKIGSQELTALNEIDEYTGPGTYAKDKLSSVAGGLDVTIDNTPYQSADDTTAQAVINADGSGSFTFADLKEGEQGNPSKPKGVISGSITWTCSD